MRRTSKRHQTSGTRQLSPTSRRPGRRGRLRATAQTTCRLGLTTFVLLAGCDGSHRNSPDAAASGPATPIPLRSPYLKAGVELLDGISVPDGAVAVGGPLRIPSDVIYQGEPAEERGWRIYFAIPNDPRPVIKNVTEQLSRQGFTMRPAELTGEDWKTTTTEFCTQNAKSYDCAGLAQATASGDRRVVALDFHRRAAENDRPPESYLRITLHDSEHPEVFNPVLGNPGTSMGPKPPPVSASWPSLPTQGGRFGDGYDPAATPFSVEPQSHLISPTIQSDDCVRPGYEALLALSGNPTSIFEAYQEQAQRIVDDTRLGPSPTIANFEDGSKLYAATVSDQGGAVYRFAMTIPQAGTPLLSISVCVD